MIRMFMGGSGRGLTATESLSDAYWIDLLNPDASTIEQVAEATGLRLPARADMEEIELSSRLYHLDGTEYLTLALPALTETEHHETAPVSFALTDTRLVTVRYHAPRPFQTYPQRATESPYGTATAQEVLYGLLDEIIDRLADILEGCDRTIEIASRKLFAEGGPGNPADMRSLVANLGRTGNLVSDVRNSILTIERALNFLDRPREGVKDARRSHRALKILATDASSLAEHATFLTQKLALLLDAAFGLTNIQQNAATKIFSLVAVLFLPPTLIGTVFGMNFQITPGLQSPFGFGLSLMAMAASSAISFVYFRWRGLL